jgi:hypothetical protein
MSETKPVTAEQTLQQTVDSVAKELEERGMLSAAARELAERHQERIFVAPTRLLVDELFAKAPDRR